MTRTVDDDEYIQFARRILRALRRRARHNAEALPGLVMLAAEITQAIDDVLITSRAHTTPEGGDQYTYQQLADLLGTTRQAIHQRCATLTARNESAVNTR